MKAPLLVALIALPILALTAALADAPAKSYPAHPYPDDFLQWKQVKAQSLDPKNPATAKLTSAHFVYANEKALEGLRTGTYPAGAVFVLDIFKVVKKDGEVALGARDSTSTMVRDASCTETGGWAFEDYDVQKRTVLADTKPVADCYNCHTKQADHGYVFTRLQD